MADEEPALAPAPARETASPAAVEPPEAAAPQQNAPDDHVAVQLPSSDAVPAKPLTVKTGDPSKGAAGEKQAQASVPDGKATSMPMPARQPGMPQPGSIPLPVPEHEHLHMMVQRARSVSIFSIVFTLCCAGLGLGFAWSTSSSALLGYSLEALVDVWSSILVLWRFWSDPEGEGHYFLITRRRESRASVGIAFTFILIGILTTTQAVYHLIEKKEVERSEVLLAISGMSVIFLTWSCAIKLSLSRKLQSTALRKDAITSGACATMAATMLVSTTIIKNHPLLWWLDAAVAVVVSIVLGALGVHTLTQHNWWTREFWVDTDLPPEERHADHIMDLPFGSPKKNYLAALHAEQELKGMQPSASAPTPVQPGGVQMAAQPKSDAKDSENAPEPGDD